MREIRFRFLAKMVVSQMRILFAMALAAGLAAGAGLVAGPAKADAGKLGSEAEALLAEGKGLEAHQKMREALIDLWSRQELTNRRAELIEEPAPSFGLYAVKNPATYQPGQEMFLYFEPIGYGWTEVDGAQVIHFVVDASLSVRGGEQIWAQEGFTELKVASGEKLTEFFGNLTFSFDGIPVGDYTLKTTLNDQATSQSVSASMDFSVRDKSP